MPQRKVMGPFASSRHKSFSLHQRLTLVLASGTTSTISKMYTWAKHYKFYLGQPMEKYTHSTLDSEIFTPVDRGPYCDEVFHPRLCAHSLERHRHHTAHEFIRSKLVPTSLVKSTPTLNRLRHLPVHRDPAIRRHKFKR